MLFGHARFNNGLEVVVLTRTTKGVNAFVRRTYKGVPTGPEIKRHIKKHAVKVHGHNVIRHDWIK